VKNLFYIATILLTFSFGYSFHVVTKTNNSHHFFSFSNVKRELKESVIVFNNSITSDSSNEKPDTLRKKRIKGVEQTLLFVSNESSFRIAIIGNKFILFSQLSYYLETFSGNGKRGPPSINSIA